MPAQRVSAADRDTTTTELLRSAVSAAPAQRELIYDEVVQLNLPVARSIARRYAHRGESLDDLLQVACVGLTKAVRGFDPDRGCHFLSYAVPTMTGEIKRHFRDQGWAVRPPRRVQEMQGAISAAVDELSQELGHSPRPSQLADRLGVEVQDISEALASDGCFSPSSLDERGPGDDGYALADHLGEDDGGFGRAEAVTMLRPACRELKPRDRRILYLRFFRGWTQAEIAGELGVTQMQVSRLLQRILVSLRRDIGEQSAVPGDSRESPA